MLGSGSPTSTKPVDELNNLNIPPWLFDNSSFKNGGKSNGGAVVKVVPVTEVSLLTDWANTSLLILVGLSVL